MLAVDDISAHVPSTNVSATPSCPAGFVLLNMVVSAEPSSSFFKYERMSEEEDNTLNRPTGAPVVDVELVGGALTNMTTRIDTTDSWKARTWDPWLQLTTWCAAPGKAWQMFPATSSIHILYLHVLSEMASYVVVCVRVCVH